MRHLGFSLPYDVSYYKVHIIYSDNNKEVAFKLYDLLNENNINCIIDDREGLGFGNRINDVYTLGTPRMIVLGNKFDGTNIEIENTKTNEKVITTFNDIVNLLK